MGIPSFTDLMDETPLDGDKISIEKVYGVPIVITGYKIGKSKFRDECITIQFCYEDDESQTRYVAFTGSKVIKDQLISIWKKLEESDNTPMFRTTIKNIGKYTSFT